MISAYPALTQAAQALEDGHHERAAQLVISHLRARPGEPRGLALLGSVAMKAGALVQAETFFRQALAHGHPEEDIRRDLASCLNQQERLDEALELFRELEASGSNNPQVKATIALISDKLGRFDEARARWEGLLAAHPGQAPFWMGYGHHLRAAGETKNAVRAYRHVVEADPERGEAWWGLASIKKNLLTDDDIAAMQQALAIAVDVANVAPLHFALGRAFHDRKQFNQAFQHFTEANRLWAEFINYDPSELSSEIRENSHIFDLDYFDSLAPDGDPSPAPIFIVSLPRSGSTLLEQMLGSHPDIEPLGELTYGPALLRSVMEDATRRGRVTVPRAIALLSPAARTALGQEYMRRATLHRKSSSPHFTDKMPHNWNNVLFLRHILPNARFIDIRRNPVDCCFANFSHSFTRAHSSSFALEHIGRAYVDYVCLMDHLDGAAPGMVHHVHYEQLIDEPEHELNAVLDYLGLPWDEACLRFYESKRTVRTPSVEQVRRPLNREGVGAWKPYKQWLGPLFDALAPVLKENQVSADSA